MDLRIRQKVRESRGNKTARVLNSHHQIYQLTLILYGVEVRYHTDIFKLTATAQFIYNEVYV